MQTFLLIVAALVVGLLAFSFIGMTWLEDRVSAVCESLVQLVQASGLPPFRIHLEEDTSPSWNDVYGVQGISRSFESKGYERVGEYAIREMEAVSLRAFWHPEMRAFAVLYDHPQAGLYADLFTQFENGTSVTFSTAPESGMDRPSGAPLFRVESDIRAEGTVAKLHERIGHEAIGREASPLEAQDFAAVFSGAYAQEMDWRIARGGVTRTEIERIAEMTGQSPPSDAQVEMIQSIWTRAIASFISEEVQRVWLADAALSGAEWEAIRDRVVIIHDRSEADGQIEILARSIAESSLGPARADDDCAAEAAYREARMTVAALFEAGPIREAFEAAQGLLPEKSRYERLGVAEEPWPADLWLTPESDDY